MQQNNASASYTKITRLNTGLDYQLCNLSSCLTVFIASNLNPPKLLLSVLLPVVGRLAFQFGLQIWQISTFGISKIAYVCRYEFHSSTKSMSNAALRLPNSNQSSHQPLTGVR